MNPAEHSRLDYMIWITIAVVALTVVASSMMSTFVVVWSSFVKAAFVCVVLALASLFYRFFRKDESLAEALLGASQVIAFASVAAPLSYIAASASFPLLDTQLAGWDRGLGFDWMAWLALMNAVPFLHTITNIAYSSFAVQTTMVVMALGFCGRTLHMRIFVLALLATTLFIIGISTLFPAQGVWGAWHLSLSDSPAIVPVTRDLPLPVFFGLRDGSYRQLVADNADGIISFPSLHAALAILFMFALWPVKRLRWAALVLNLAMIASTPIDGSHYLTDVIAGVVISALCWSVVRRCVMGDQSRPVLQRSGKVADRGQFAALLNN